MRVTFFPYKKSVYAFNVIGALPNTALTSGIAPLANPPTDLTLLYLSTISSNTNLLWCLLHRDLTRRSLNHNNIHFFHHSIMLCQLRRFLFSWQYRLTPAFSPARANDFWNQSVVKHFVQLFWRSFRFHLEFFAFFNMVIHLSIPLIHIPALDYISCFLLLKMFS